MIVRTYYWGSAIGAICMLAVAGIAGAESGEWKLPDKIDISATSMQVSSNHGHVLFLELGKSSRRTSEILRSVFPSAYWSLDTQSGELTNLLDLLETEEDEGKLMVRPRGFSADGKHVLLMAVRIKQKQARRAKQRGLSAYIVTLQSGAVQKIGERIVSAAWVGNKAALSGLEGTGTRLKIGRIKLVDPADASTTELNVGGLIVCGHPDGRMLVYGCDATEPAKEVSRQSLARAKLVVITTEGEVLREVEAAPPTAVRHDQLILSPNGKYAAFREGNLRRGRRPRSVKVRVMTTNGDEDKVINEAATPIGMTDDGRVVTLGHVFDSKGAAVKLWDKELNSRTVVEEAAAAAVAGAQLYYLTTGEQQLIKRVELGELQKPSEEAKPEKLQGGDAGSDEAVGSSETLDDVSAGNGGS